METNKYELTDETIEWKGHTLYRIKAIKTFGKFPYEVFEGNFGGYVESENNLSQKDNCWIFDDAKVYGDAQVFDDAKVCCNARVFDNARVKGNAQVYENAEIFDYAMLWEDSQVWEKAKVYEHARVWGRAVINDNAEIFGESIIKDDARVFDYSKVYENSKVYGTAEVRGNSLIHGDAKVGELAEISGDAEIKEMGDYIVSHNSWSSGRYFTWTKSNDMWKVGCFYGTGKELIEKAYKDSEISGKNYEKYVNFVETFK